MIQLAYPDEFNRLRNIDILHHPEI